MLYVISPHLEHFDFVLLINLNYNDVINDSLCGYVWPVILGTFIHQTLLSDSRELHVHRFHCDCHVGTTKITHFSLYYSQIIQNLAQMRHSFKNSMVWYSKKLYKYQNSMFLPKITQAEVTWNLSEHITLRSQESWWVLLYQFWIPTMKFTLFRNKSLKSHFYYFFLKTLNNIAFIIESFWT